ncbi:MAG TPA: glutamate-1-semialdehyde 2,1-aminomutase [Candidatus Dormibacteraeota bacterium]|nr:glutamate-1-semialdehyde 2,1-aminomutase [Candidatus Dormibacteraeota bacterium]
MIVDRSSALFERSKRVIPGGVNSPVRAFRAVGGVPRFVARGEGAYLEDVDGNRYVDYVGSWGPLIAGHAHPDVVRAIQLAAARGSSFGAPTEAEAELAELVVEMVPSIEMVRFVSSGTEATMSALRVARGYTEREKVVKFDGCYHGHADAFLVNAGSGALTFGSPDSPGVTEGTARDTLSAPYNDLDAVRRLFAENPDRIACVIVEPYAGNMGLVMPEPGFLDGLRRITREHGALLIFDEVMTGLRVARGGAQEREGVLPDLTTLGKVIGGGLPVGAFGGRAEIMSRLSPLGPIYQAGTLSGNPLAMAAGIATLRLLRDGSAYERLEGLGARLARGLGETFARRGVAAQHTRAGSMLCTFFADAPVRDLASAKRSDAGRYAAYFHAMLERGVWLAPSQFEVAFVSLAHGEAEIDATIAAADAALAAVEAPA